MYGALDSFVAWELEFPLIAVKKALKTLENEQEWKRIIQVTGKPFSPPFFGYVKLCIIELVKKKIGIVGNKVDAEQRPRTDNGNILHLTQCFSRGWEA